MTSSTPPHPTDQHLDPESERDPAVSPFSAPVLLGAAIVSAPSLWGAFVVGSTSTQTALVRFIACAALAWVALAVLSMLVGPAPRPQRVVAEPAEPPAPVEAGAAQG